MIPCPTRCSEIYVVSGDLPAPSSRERRQGTLATAHARRRQRVARLSPGDLVWSRRAGWRAWYRCATCCWRTPDARIVGYRAARAADGASAG